MSNHGPVVTDWANGATDDRLEGSFGGTGNLKPPLGIAT